MPRYGWLHLAALLPLLRKPPNQPRVSAIKKRGTVAE